MSKKQIDVDLHAANYMAELSREQSFEAILSNSRKKQVLESMKRFKHDNILEIGCGLSPLFPDIKNYQNYTIVEPNKNFCEIIYYCYKTDKNVTILNGFLEEVVGGLGHQKFDFIFMSGVLHQVSNPNDFLCVLHNLCGLDTVVHINVPNAHSFHRLLAFEMGYIKEIFERSETNLRLQVKWVFDKDSLYQLVQESGYEVINFGTYMIKPFTNEQMEKMIGSGILNEDIIQGLEGMVKYMPDLGSEMFVNLRINNDLY